MNTLIALLITLSTAQAATIDGDTRKTFAQSLCAGQKLMQVGIGSNCTKGGSKGCMVQAAISDGPWKDFEFANAKAKDKESFTATPECKDVHLTTTANRKVVLPSGCQVTLNVKANLRWNASYGGKEPGPDFVQCVCERSECRAAEPTYEAQAPNKAGVQPTSGAPASGN